MEIVFDSLNTSYFKTKNNFSILIFSALIHLGRRRWNLTQSTKIALSLELAHKHIVNELIHLIVNVVILSDGKDFIFLILNYLVHHLSAANKLCLEFPLGQKFQVSVEKIVGVTYLSLSAQLPVWKYYKVLF